MQKPSDTVCHANAWCKESLGNKRKELSFTAAKRPETALHNPPPVRVAVDGWSFNIMKEEEGRLGSIVSARDMTSFSWSDDFRMDPGEVVAEENRVELHK